MHDVIPAKAGIHLRSGVVPRGPEMDFRLRGNDGRDFGAGRAAGPGVSVSSPDLGAGRLPGAPSDPLEPFMLWLNQNMGAKFLFYRVSEPQKWCPLLPETL